MVLAVLDFSQLWKDYDKEQVDAIMNIFGNIISGNVTDDTAKQLSERFGKIIQRVTPILLINPTLSSVIPTNSKMLLPV